MNTENAERFYEKSRQDPALWARVQQAISGKSDTEAAAVIAGLAKGAGFDFTAAEALAFREKKAGEHARDLNKLIAKAWMDDKFSQRLQSDPAAVLKQEGIEMTPGVEVRVVANSEKVFHLVLPARPAELSEEQLATVAGGTCNVSACVNALGPAPPPACSCWGFGWNPGCCC